MTASSSAIVDEPHSGRVGLSRSVNHQRANVTTETSLPSPPASPLPSPPLPPRSPLRPRVNQSNTDSRSSISLDSIAEVLDMTLLRSRSLGSISVLDGHLDLRPKTPDKPLPMPPPSPLRDGEVFVRDQFSTNVLPPLPSPPLPSPLPPSAPVSKRTHALLELLSSERAYASDLALIQTIHIPLALGQPASLDAPLTPPPSGPSSRAASTASSSSSGSLNNGPMSPEDIRIIFNNIAQIAAFADQFTIRLEEALGSVIEEGMGEDHVGALFLEMIPVMEPMYNTYITKHPAAREHLDSLPRTEALKDYLTHTQALAQSLSHAWDLPSLLIKPVQRLMKYPLLLSAIIEETPATHSDKGNLKKARERMEEVTQGVNEGRRRLEVVKEVLTGGPKRVWDVRAKKKGLNLGIGSAIKLGRIKNSSGGAYKPTQGPEASAEARDISEWREELRVYQRFCRLFLARAKQWAKTCTTMVEELRTWTQDFGRVIGVHQQESPAFHAFLAVIEDGLLKACRDMEASIDSQLGVELARLKNSTDGPEKLLEAMRTLEPVHYQLMDLDASKMRQEPSLLEASQSYTALRVQLHKELPIFLQLLRRGISCVLMEFLDWQVAFYDTMQTKWADLWDALKVDGEMRGPAEEILTVWWSRFADTEDRLRSLNILRPLQKEHSARPRPRPRGLSLTETIETGSTRSTVVISKLNSFDPYYPPPISTSSSQTLCPPSPGGSVKAKNVEKRKSNDSVHSKKSGKSSTKSSHKHSNSSVSQQQYRDDLFVPDGSPASYAHSIHTIAPSTPQKPSYQRTASMPISLPMPLRKSNSQGRLLSNDITPSASSSCRTLNVHSSPSTPPSQPDGRIDERGRSPRKPGMKRRMTDSIKSTKSSTSRGRRSPSLSLSRTLKNPSYSTLPASPTSTVFNINEPRILHNPNAHSLYQCQVIFPCTPPSGVSYRHLPFFTLELGDVYDVLDEYGHPSLYRDLPLQLDDGEDCLLMVRNTHKEVGWALASFLFPVD